MLETNHERQKNLKSLIVAYFICSVKAHDRKKIRKGVRGMPWLSEAKKDVISCDKPRGLANTN